jgi:hypothetical protein
MLRPENKSQNSDNTPLAFILSTGGGEGEDRKPKSCQFFTLSQGDYTSVSLFIILNVTRLWGALWPDDS